MFQGQISLPAKITINYFSEVAVSFWFFLRNVYQILKPKKIISQTFIFIINEVLWQILAISAHNGNHHKSAFLKTTIIIWLGEECCMCTFLIITQNDKKTHAKKLRLNEYNIFTVFSKICMSMCVVKNTELWIQFGALLYLG